MTPEFFDGPISREYREVLESESRFETAPAKKSGTGGTKCKSDRLVCPKPGTEGTRCKTDPTVCPKPGTEGTKCKTDPTVCPRKFGTEGTRCKSETRVCPKKHAIALSVPGWSLPPAPLS
jgi:hypothetical protein